MNRDLALLKLQAAPGIGPRTLYDLLTRLGEENCDLVEFVQLPREELVNNYALGEYAADYLAADDDLLEQTYLQLQFREIGVMALGDAAYPQKLQRALERAAPPLLFVWGNRELLKRPLVAICGAREASAVSTTTAHQSATQLAQSQIVVLSGNAKGIDTAAHGGALSGGGATIVVTPLGILNFQYRTEYGSLADEHNTLVISEFPPRLTWQAHNAMIRNRTIAALCDAMIVFEAGLTGGTLEAGKTALAQGKPLFVADFVTESDTAPGNRKLVGGGGQLLSFDPDGTPDLEPILAVLAEQA
ncbi:MAG: DNA-processing protein DprA [bacterium]